MKNIVYDGKIFKQAFPGHAAVRCHKKDRFLILNFEPNGEVTCKSRTVSPSLYAALKSLFTKEELDNE